MPLNDIFSNDVVHTTANFLADINVTLFDEDFFDDTLLRESDLFGVTASSFCDSQDNFSDDLNFEETPVTFAHVKPIVLDNTSFALPVASLLVPENVVTTEIIDNENSLNFIDLDFYSNYVESSTEQYKYNNRVHNIIEINKNDDLSITEQKDCQTVLNTVENKATTLATETIHKQHIASSRSTNCHTSFRKNITKKSALKAKSSLVQEKPTAEESKLNRAKAKEKLVAKRQRFRERLLFIASGGILSETVQWNKARKEAAAKRERVNGKFRRCKYTWKSLAEIQKPSDASFSVACDNNTCS